MPRQLIKLKVLLEHEFMYRPPWPKLPAKVKLKIGRMDLRVPDDELAFCCCFAAPDDLYMMADPGLPVYVRWWVARIIEGPDHYTIDLLALKEVKQALQEAEMWQPGDRMVVQRVEETVNALQEAFAPTPAKPAKPQKKTKTVNRRRTEWQIAE